MINQQIQNYSIISLLGEGGMANVYLAQHQSLGNNVAVKLLKEEFVQHPNIRKRFLAEARSLAKMNHPNVIKVTDLIDAGDIVAFVMEYVEGQTLEAFLSSSGKLSNVEIERMFSQMILAVEYVHSQGLIHRDIKPSNFMLTPEGSIKLLDFGIAKNLNDYAVDYTKTSMAQQMGTPMYMSPEQVRNTAEITEKSDIYSLGVVLWQMVMNKKPYNSVVLTLPEIQVAIMKDQLPLTNTIWDSTIKEATAKVPAKRSLKINAKKGVESISVSDTEIDPLIPKQNPKKEKREKKTYFNVKTISIGVGILLVIGLLVISLSKGQTADTAVTVNPADTNLKIGQKHQGGIIFYLDDSGKHGKVCTENDMGEMDWKEAVDRCRNLSLKGFNDWYLPSKEELEQLYQSRQVVGGFTDGGYWSSIAYIGYDGWCGAWYRFFEGGISECNLGNQKAILYVRAIRSF